MNGFVSGCWYPVIDGNLFPEHSTKLLATGQYHRIPMVDGINTDEGTENVSPSIYGTLLATLLLFLTSHSFAFQ